MKVPFSYVARNLWVRKLTTGLTAGGMALVVFVFAAVLMLDAGLKSTLVSTGSADNVVVIRQGSQTEVQSGVFCDQASLIETSPELARAANGQAFVSKEIVVLNSLPKLDDPSKRSNVVVRGMPENGVAAATAGDDRRRPHVPARYLGNRRRPVSRAPIFRCQNRAAVVIRPPAGADTTAFERLKARLDDDPRLKVDIKREHQFYEDQSASLSNFITLLGMALSIIFSLGAMIGATITMYAAVATRTSEIGTLRALGFQRASILAAFLAESLLLALLGGLAGLFAASFLTAITVSTTNFQSFSELAFSFRLTPRIFMQALAFALLMGFVGGFLPAIQASRMKIVDALRAA